MSTFLKLKERILKDTGINLTNFQRQYAGYWQKSQGAFSWIAMEQDESGNIISIKDYGSSWSASELLKEKQPLIILGNEIIPST